MPSTYTSRMRAERPQTGEQAGVWGGTVNFNISDIFDEAIDGVGVVNLSDSNTTLTIPNGAPSPNRRSDLAFYGTLTATRQITLPDLDRLYVVENFTAQPLTFVTPSAVTPVGVPAGRAAEIVVSGTTIRLLLRSVPAGSVVSPGLGIGSNPGTGLYEVSGGGIGLGVNGSPVLTIGTDGNPETPGTIAASGIRGRSGSGIADSFNLNRESTLSPVIALRGATYPGLPSGIHVVTGAPGAEKTFTFDQGGNFYTPGSMTVPVNTGAGFFIGSGAGSAYMHKVSPGHFALWFRSPDAGMTWDVGNGVLSWIQNNIQAMFLTWAGGLWLKDSLTVSTNLVAGGAATIGGAFQAAYVTSTGGMRALGGISFANSGDLANAFKVGWSSTWNGWTSWVNDNYVGILPRTNNVPYFNMQDYGGHYSMIVTQTDAVNIVLFADVISDQRMKQNIADTQVDALEEIGHLRIVQYDWTDAALAKLYRDPARRHVRIGVIGQAARTHLPEMILEPTAEQDPDRYLMFKKDEAVPYLLRAVQQLKTRLEALEAHS